MDDFLYSGQKRVNLGPYQLKTVKKETSVWISTQPPILTIILPDYIDLCIN